MRWHTPTCLVHLFRPNGPGRARRPQVRVCCPCGRGQPAYKGGEGVPGEQYYALCVQEQDGSTEIAFFELRREALPGALGISLYTSSDGELQRRHLQGNDVVIVAKSPR